MVHVSSMKVEFSPSLLYRGWQSAGYTVGSSAEEYSLVLRYVGSGVGQPEFESQLHQYYSCDLGKITSPFHAFVLSYPICKIKKVVFIS